MDLKEYLLSGSPSKKAIKSKLIPAKEPVFSTGLTPQQEKEAINSGQDSSNKLQMEKLIPSIEPQVEKNNYENALSKVDSTGSKAYRALTGAFLGLGGQSGREIMDTTNAMRERSLNSGVQNDLVNPESNLTKNYQSLGTQLGIPNAKKQTGHDLSSFVDPFMKLDYLKAKVQAAAARKSGVSSREKPLTAEVQKLASNSAMALNAIHGMKNALSKGDNTFSLIGDNDFTMNQNQFAEGLGRLVSGGQISDQERKNFLKMAPTVADTKNIQQKKLAQMQAEFESRLKMAGLDPNETIRERQQSSNSPDPKQITTTKLQMPDGSIGEFDLTGKRIK